MRNVVAVTAAVFALLLPFQNCSEGFKPYNSTALDSTAGEPVPGSGPDSELVCPTGFVKVAGACEPQYVPAANSLRAYAAARGLMIGTALNYNHMMNVAEPSYSNIAKAHFNMLTPENEMKMEILRPTQNTFDFSRADAIADFALRSGAKLRGHTLAWHQQNPTWLTSGSFTPAQKQAILEDHIAQTIGHYKTKYPGLVTVWDVVNEAQEPLAAPLRNIIWSDIGTAADDYIKIAFRAAAKADPTAKLAINDFANEDLGAKSNALFNLVSRWKQEGVPIHAVGFEMHLSTEYASPPVADMRANIRRYAGIGVEVHFTEVDVRTDTAGGISALELQRQSEFYSNLITACTSEPNCKVFTLWGFTEKFSWIPGAFTGFVPTLPWDSNYQAGGIFNILRNGLSGIN